MRVMRVHAKGWVVPGKGENQTERASQKLLHTYESKG